MKKSIVVSIIVFVIALSFIGGISHAAEKVVTLELSSFMPATEKKQIMLQEFADEVGKRTSGRIKINMHPGATLTPPTQTFDSVEKEIIDLGFGPLGATGGRFPLLEVMELSLGLNSSYNASRLATELVKHFKPKETAKVKVIFMLSSPPVALETKRPVKTLEDLKGMKIRSMGGVTVKYITALGAVPVTISPSDAYDAFSKGVAEGAILPPDAVMSLKIGDILKYTTTLGRNTYVNSGYLVMNLNKWNSLPPDLQKIVDKVSDEYLEKMSKLWDWEEEESIRKLKAIGNAFSSLSRQEEEKWAKRLESLSQEYVKEKSEKGVPAADVLKFCQEWIKKNQK
jgi:TRAP-type transport system periplasmic protein